MSIFEKLGIPEKLPLQSKKWLSAMIWTTLWMFLVWYGIKSKIDSSALTAMIYSAGIIQSLYLGGQAAVDAFVRRRVDTSEK